MRVVIVGGGVIALLTAIECVSAGHRVQLVDAADIPFSGATSFDRHRVLRALHPDDPAATAAAVRAHHRWLAVADLLATEFYQQVGALTVLPAGQPARAAAVLAEAGCPARELSSAELAAAYPQLRFQPGAGGVLERCAGVLLADRVLAACAGWLRWHGGAELHPHRSAVAVRPGRDGGTVLLADGEALTADAVLLATGPWSRSLLPDALAADLVLHRQSLLYCDVPEPSPWSVLPPVLGLGADRGAWLVPPVAGTPLKLSAADACREVAEVGDRQTAAHWRDHLVDTFTALVPGFDASWVGDAKDCYYLTSRRTGGAVLAELGERVLAYAACGGSSFKFAPLIAENLAARLAGGRPAPTGLAPLDAPTALPALRGAS